MREREEAIPTDRTEALYREHKDRVFRIALRMVGEKEAAEDIVQDVFLTVMRKIDAFRGESGLFSWLYRIAVNKAISHLRWRGLRRVKEIFPWKEGRSENEMDLSERVEFKRELEKGLGSLSKGERAIFILHDIEGFTHKEIAEIRDCSPGTVKSQLFRARLRLRGKLLPFLELSRRGDRV
jgi:RNA polymerase sigma-70 factor (ECF subfamily)